MISKKDIAAYRYNDAQAVIDRLIDDVEDQRHLVRMQEHRIRKLENEQSDLFFGLGLIIQEFGGRVSIARSRFLDFDQNFTLTKWEDFEKDTIEIRLEKNARRIGY